MQKTSSALKRTGTKIKETGSAIYESETVKNVGAKIRTASTSIKVRWISIMIANHLRLSSLCVTCINTHSLSNAHTHRIEYGHQQINLMVLYQREIPQPKVKQWSLMSPPKSEQTLRDLYLAFMVTIRCLPPAFHTHTHTCTHVCTLAVIIHVLDHFKEYIFILYICTDYCWFAVVFK